MNHQPNKNYKKALKANTNLVRPVAAFADLTLDKQRCFLSHKGTV